MRAGLLNKKVSIEQYSTTQDAYGEFIETWSHLTYIRAGIRPLSSRELMNAQQVQAETTHEITVRYLAGISHKDRIIWDSRTFEIISIINPHERNKMLIFHCKEIE